MKRPHDGGGESTAADAETLPETWTAPPDDRDCDRCPKDGTRFVTHGRRFCLCEDCYQNVVLGRTR